MKILIHKLPLYGNVTFTEYLTYFSLSGRHRAMYPIGYVLLDHATNPLASRVFHGSRL